MLIILMYTIPFATPDTFEGNVVTTGSGEFNLKSIKVQPDQKIIIKVQLSSPAIVKIIIGSEVLSNNTVENIIEFEFVSETIDYISIAIISEGLSIEVNYSYIISGIPNAYIKTLLISFIFVMLSLISKISGIEYMNSSELSTGKKQVLFDTVKTTLKIELSRSNAIGLVLPILLTSFYIFNLSTIIITDPNQIINDTHIYIPDIEFSYYFYYFTKIFLIAITFGIPIILSHDIIDDFNNRSKHEKILPIDPRIVIITRSFIQFLLIYPSIFIFVIFRLMMVLPRSGLQINLNIVIIVLLLTIVISFTFILIINFTTWLFKSLQIPIYGLFIIIIRLLYSKMLNVLYSFNLLETNYIIDKIKNKTINYDYIPMYFVSRISFLILIVSGVQFLLMFFLIGKLDKISNKFDNSFFIVNKYNLCKEYIIGKLNNN